MLTIRTRFHGPTNTRGARMVATADPNNITGRASVAYDYSLDSIGNHRAAVVALMAKLGRTGELRAASWMGDYYWSEDPQDVRYSVEC